MQEFASLKSKNSFLCAMTSTSGDPGLPAWHRQLPKPTVAAQPLLPRPSSISHHRLFADRPLGQGSHEDGPRRHSVPFIATSTPAAAAPPPPSVPARDHVEVHGTLARGGLGPTSPLIRHPDMEMTEASARPGDSNSSSISRENLCLCPPSPKIPRPRNCETDPLLFLVIQKPHLLCSFIALCTQLTLFDSVHSFPSASTSKHHRAKPRDSESGGVKDHWRTMAKSVR